MSQKKNGFQYNNLFLVAVPSENRYVIAHNREDAVAHLGPLTSELAIREDFDSSTLKSNVIVDDIRVSVVHVDVADYVIGLDPAPEGDRAVVSMFERIDGGELALVDSVVLDPLAASGDSEVSTPNTEHQPETTETPVAKKPQQPKNTRKKDPK